MIMQKNERNERVCGGKYAPRVVFDRQTDLMVLASLPALMMATVLEFALMSPMALLTLGIGFGIDVWAFQSISWQFTLILT